MSEWGYCKLGDLVSIKGGKRLPKGTNLIKIANQHPYIRIRDLGKSKHLELDSSYEYVDDETHKSISRYIVNQGDIVLTIVGTIGLVGVIGRSLHLANLTENCVKLVELKNNIDKDFLYYFLVSKIGQTEIQKGIVGAVQPKLPIKNIANITISLPPLEEQKRIAGILSTLDDEIELNRRINENLEQQAQALFKHWFVDFMPFKDCDFVESELGIIPKEWRVGVLEELIEIKYGKDHKKLKNGSIPVYGSGGIMHFVDTAIYSEESILIPRKGTLNNVIYVNKPFWTIDTMFYTRMKYDGIASFLFLFLKSLNLQLMNCGSAVPSMTTKILNSIKLIIPPLDIILKFENIVSPIYKTYFHNRDENKRLAELRDTLLPKLMNGEITINS